MTIHQDRKQLVVAVEAITEVEVEMKGIITEGVEGVSRGALDMMVSPIIMATEMGKVKMGSRGGVVVEVEVNEEEASAEEAGDEADMIKIGMKEP